MELFGNDDAKRQRLTAQGWRQHGGMLQGRMMWQAPNGRAYSEDEAFGMLEKLDALLEALDATEQVQRSEDDGGRDPL